MELFIDIKEELEMVESELGVAVQAENQLLLETYKYLLNAGGKRLRPALCFYGAKFCDFDLQRLLPLAVALELIHMATLVHDDVVDASILRRGKPTINAIWGDSVSTHLGSYLFAEALLLLTRNDYPQIVYDKLSRVGVKMCEGELQQISAAFDVTLNTRRYLQRINRKTAMLIAASAQLGAIASGSPPNIYLPLSRYGHGLGMAFQITDDILDLIADRKELGKPIGNDLRQGTITLPVILALCYDGPKMRLKKLVLKPQKDEAEMREAIDIIVGSGAIEQSYLLVDKYIGKAKRALEELPDIPAKISLQQTADFVARRKF
ncbi:MAG: polyprenyl synthetase family protein [Pelotomaculum sp.]